MVVTGCQVRTIRWVGDDIPFNLLQESDGLTGDVAESWYDIGIQKLPQRLQKCIDRNCDYVEKQINVQALK